MSGDRALPPHEVARRDQVAADMKARLLRGENVIVVDEAHPGTPCSYCDCPIGPDSPHNRRGYVCPYFCHANSVVVAILLYLPKPKYIPLCDRHYDAWLADLMELTAGPYIFSFIDARTGQG